MTCYLFKHKDTFTFIFIFIVPFYTSHDLCNFLFLLRIIKNR